jgi:hypothetical protein
MCEWLCFWKWKRCHGSRKLSGGWVWKCATSFFGKTIKYCLSLKKKSDFNSFLFTGGLAEYLVYSPRFIYVFQQLKTSFLLCSTRGGCVCTQFCPDASRQGLLLYGRPADIPRGSFSSLSLSLSLSLFPNRHRHRAIAADRCPSSAASAPHAARRPQHRHPLPLPLPPEHRPPPPTPPPPNPSQRAAAAPNRLPERHRHAQAPLPPRTVELYKFLNYWM